MGCTAQLNPAAVPQEGALLLDQSFSTHALMPVMVTRLVSPSLAWSTCGARQLQFSALRQQPRARGVGRSTRNVPAAARRGWSSLPLQQLHCAGTVRLSPANLSRTAQGSAHAQAGLHPHSGSGGRSAVPHLDARVGGQLQVADRLARLADQLAHLAGGDVQDLHGALRQGWGAGVGARGQGFGRRRARRALDGANHPPPWPRRRCGPQPLGAPPAAPRASPPRGWRPEGPQPRPPGPRPTACLGPAAPPPPPHAAACCCRSRVRHLRPAAENGRNWGAREQDRPKTKAAHGAGSFVGAVKRPICVPEGCSHHQARCNGGGLRCSRGRVHGGLGGLLSLPLCCGRLLGFIGRGGGLRGAAISPSIDGRHLLGRRLLLGLLLLLLRVRHGLRWSRIVPRGGASRPSKQASRPHARAGGITRAPCSRRAVWQAAITAYNRSRAPPAAPAPRPADPSSLAAPYARCSACSAPHAAGNSTPCRLGATTGCGRPRGVSSGGGEPPPPPGFETATQALLSLPVLWACPPDQHALASPTSLRRCREHGAWAARDGGQVAAAHGAAITTRRRSLT